MAQFDTQLSTQQPIAIVGMACKFPGAGNHREFWHNMRSGVSSIREVPPSRWSVERYYNADPDAPGASISKWAGLVDDVDKFDAAFFRISPHEAALMDPQQRLLLELSWACCEDAGIAPSMLRGKPVGVYVGVCNFDYKELLERQMLAPDAHLSTGTYISLIANRISHEFDLKGPSMAIDTACSSALVALHQATQALASGECSAAFVGGVSILCSPTYFISFSKAGMLSPEGKCRTFDERASGYVRGEGAGMLLLKPLARAIADADRIWGVVRGSAVNHGGRAPSVTSPGAFAQARVIADACRKAAAAPNTISYVEAHGTGTPKGDPIEMHGLQRAFSTLAEEFGVRLEPQSCAVGSVKTNIGHLEAAAGVAGIIKTLLAMKHGELPGLVDFGRLNPRIRLDKTPFFIADRPRPWHPSGTAPRRAGVSSFGFGGVNAHVVLEEYVGSDAPLASEAKEWVFPLSARSDERLHAYAAELARELPDSGEEAVVARALQRREALEHRLAVVTASLSELRRELERFAVGAPPSAESIRHAGDHSLLCRGLRHRKRV